MPNAGVVDQDVDGLTQYANDREEVIDRFRAADIAGLRQDIDVQLVQFKVCLGQGALVAAGDNQIASLTREGAGDGETDATIGAGDEIGRASCRERVSECV